MADKVDVPKLIGKRTKEGDRVFDGLAVFDVMHRIGNMLVLRPVGADFHYYARNIEGGSQRFTGYQDALNAAALPAVVAGVELARASR